MPEREDTQDGDRERRIGLLDDLGGKPVQGSAGGARGVAKQSESLLERKREPLGEDSLCLLDHDAGVERLLQLLDRRL